MGILLAFLKLGQLSGRLAKIALGKMNPTDESLIILSKDGLLWVFLYAQSCMCQVF